MTYRSDVHYARSADGIDIAYQIIGDGPVDLVYVPGFVSHLDMQWELPAFSGILENISEGTRVLTFDKRGTGLSDRSLGFGSIADRMDDIRTVMDAASYDRAALLGVSEGGPLTLVFTATYPDRVTKLGLYGTFARARWAPDYQIGVQPEESDRLFHLIAKYWGTGRLMRWLIPDAPDEATPLLARYERASCSRQLCEEIMRKNVDMDVRDVLAAISVPTIVTHNQGDSVASVEFGRYLAEHIAGAEYVEYPGAAHASWTPTRYPELMNFLRGDSLASPDLDRMLATVLFTDIVSSTEQTARVGDQSWTQILNHHDRIAQNEVDRFKGRLVKNTGDGLLATFDGPARAIGCAQAINKRASEIGVGVRAGLHTGEIELRGTDVAGIGVVIARRICDTANGGEVLASRTVKDLVTGSGISFDDRGSHALKGVPDDWQLYAVG